MHTVTFASEAKDYLWTFLEEHKALLMRFSIEAVLPPIDGYLVEMGYNAETFFDTITIQPVNKDLDPAGEPQTFDLDRDISVHIY